MKNQYFLSFIFLSFIILTSCNPDCESYTRISMEITPNIRQPGEEVMVKTTPAVFLENREIFLERFSNGSLIIDDSTQLKSTYNPELQARIATLPAWAEGNRNIYVKDEDCGGFFPLANLQIADQDYINQNASLFVTPAPPVIIIPSPPIPAPTNVVNTWFSPDDPNYCIWFFPEMTIKVDDDGNKCYVESNQLERGVAPGVGSMELTCDGLGLGHNNPVSGIFDQETGYIDIVIDRREKGIGEERYSGQIVEPSSLPGFYRTGHWCGLTDTDLKESVAMVVLKSELTGRELVMYRYANESITVEEEEIFPCN